MTDLPISRRRPWYTTDVTATLFAALPGFLTAIAGIIKGAHEGGRDVVELGLAVVVALAIGTTFRTLQSRRRDARDASRESPRDLEGCLYVLHAAVLAMRGLPYEDHAIAKLRVTLFRVLEREDRAVQIVPFVGGGSGGEGRISSTRSGIVGRAVLREKPAGMIRDGSFDEYVQELVEDFAVPGREARVLDDDRFSFLAVPLKRRNTNDVVGVVYMDSPDASFFSDPDAPHAEIEDKFAKRVAAACTGLSAYAELRYSAKGSER